MAVGIVRTGWSGTSGGPGITQWAIAETLEGGVGSFFTQTNVQIAVNEMRVFWDTVKGLIPNEVTLTVSPTVDIYDEVSGDLIGSITATTSPLTVAGTDAGAFSMASGMKVKLATGTIRNGRRVAGATYIVPGGASSFNTSGVVPSTPRTTVNNAGNAFRVAMLAQLILHVVYSRPVTADPDATPPVVARDGALAEITAYDTNEKTAILRGRRD
jgi:hypothetical protein